MSSAPFTTSRCFTYMSNFTKECIEKELRLFNGYGFIYTFKEYGLSHNEVHRSSTINGEVFGIKEFPTALQSNPEVVTLDPFSIYTFVGVVNRSHDYHMTLTTVHVLSNDITDGNDIRRIVGYLHINSEKVVPFSYVE